VRAATILSIEKKGTKAKQRKGGSRTTFSLGAKNVDLKTFLENG
jgi:hypothetical protein